MKESISKISFYYEPAKSSYEYIKSASLVFSRMDNDDNIYRQKYVLEHKSKKRNQIEEYRIIEVHFGADEIKTKMDSFDFDKLYPEAYKDDAHEYFYITYGDKVIETSDRNSIQDILDAFRFDELLTVTHKHFEYIGNVYEYLDLMKVLNSKVSDLSKDRLITLVDNFKLINPYKFFENIGNIENYLDILSKK